MGNRKKMTQYKIKPLEWIKLREGFLKSENFDKHFYIDSTGSGIKLDVHLNDEDLTLLHSTIHRSVEDAISWANYFWEDYLKQYLEEVK